MSVTKIFIEMLNNVWTSARVRDECVVAELHQPVPAPVMSVAGDKRYKRLWSKRRGGVVLERLELQEVQVLRLHKMLCLLLNNEARRRL